MQTFYKRFSVVLGFGLLLIVVLASAWVTRQQLGIQVRNHYWVKHTDDVLGELNQTQSLVTDAETGQRGYLYTGDRKYLAPYNLALSQVDPNISRVEQLTADNPTQQARIAQLRSVTHQKLDELAQTIALNQAGRVDEAKGLVLSDRGLLLMNDIRGQVAAMEQEETALQTVRLNAYERSAKVTAWCIYLSSGLAVLGLVLLAYYVLHEMNLRERHAAEIQERQEWFRVTLTSIGDAVIATDERGCVTFLNPIAEELLKRDITWANGKSVEEVFPIFNETTGETVANPVTKVMALGRVVGLANHTVLQRPDGTEIPIEDSAAPIRDNSDRIVGVVLVFRDATHDRKSQDIVRKSEKLAAAARLAATMAHEINNPLEAIGNLLYIAKGTPGVPETAIQQLSAAEHELERVSHITRQTLGFFREQKSKTPVDLPTLVEAVLKIYSSKLSSKHILVVREFGDCPPIPGMAGELTQVISNLISNAADAVSEGGTIRVKLGCVEASGETRVEVKVQDDGPGIPADLHEKIFEPFFTTKKDVGTGLGLWVTKEIIERHGGKIEVLPPNGVPGTAFSVLLPLSESEA